MLGRAYMVAKKNKSFMRAGGILIWSSGSGLNIMGTDSASIIFFHDENGYFSDDFHHKTLFFCSRKFIKNEKFMQSLLKLDNQNKQVLIEDSSGKESLARSVFLKQKKSIDLLLNCKNQKKQKQVKVPSSLYSWIQLIMKEV